MGPRDKPEGDTAFEVIHAEQAEAHLGPGPLPHAASRMRVRDDAGGGCVRAVERPERAGWDDGGARGEGGATNPAGRGPWSGERAAVDGLDMDGGGVHYGKAAVLAAEGEKKIGAAEQDDLGASRAA
jgi:hypothetical protein